MKIQLCTLLRDGTISLVNRGGRFNFLEEMYELLWHAPFGFPAKVFAKFLKKRCREITETKPVKRQCGFRPGRSTTDQIFTLQQVFEKFWVFTRLKVYYKWKKFVL